MKQILLGLILLPHHLHVILYKTVVLVGLCHQKLMLLCLLLLAHLDLKIALVSCLLHQ